MVFLAVSGSGDLGGHINSLRLAVMCSHGVVILAVKWAVVVTVVVTSNSLRLAVSMFTWGVVKSAHSPISRRNKL